MEHTDNASRVLIEPKQCICGGAGWVSLNVRHGHPSFGKLARCICGKAADTKQKREWLWTQSGLFRHSIDRRPPPGFSDYKPRDKSQRKALDAAILWSQGEGKPTVVLAGKPGLGKSHLAKAAIAAVIGRDIRAVYMSMADLVSEGKRRMDDHTYGEWWESLLQAEYLAVDDLGREYATEWTRAAMYEMVDRRWASRMRTFYTSNFTEIEQLQRSGNAAVIDRLMDVTVTDYIEMGGESMRLQQREETVELIRW